MIEYGANLILCEPTLVARETTLADWIAKSEAIEIPPYNHPLTITGQATCAFEFIHQMAPIHLNYLLVPIGGGGLASGTCLAAKALDPYCKIIGVEPILVNDALQSLAAGTLIRAPEKSETIADGLKTSMGSLTWPIIKEHISQIIAVSEEEIKIATLFMMQRAKLVVEPSSCTVVAAMMFHSHEFIPSAQDGIQLHVGLILTGGNFDLCKVFDF
jgi:threonine dehydratase